MDIEPPHALVAGGIAAAPAPEAGGCAAAPEVPRPEEDIESETVDLPSLLQAYKKSDMGWFMTRQQILRTPEDKFSHAGPRGGSACPLFACGVAQNPHYR